MKIMTFNTQHGLNFLEKCIDYDVMAKTINELGADVVGLNEMFDIGSEYGTQTKFISEKTELENHFFAEAVAFDGEGAYGNGLISRYKIVNAECIKIPDPEPKRYNDYYETRCVLKAELENGLLVLVCHFGLNPDEQENAVKTILENIRDTKCILMGDFNVEPSNPVLKPLYKKMNDASEGFCKDTPTWPSDKPKIKIDYIFTSPDIKVKWAQIPELIASDHRVHIAEIEF